MKKIIIIILVVVTACNNQVKTGAQNNTDTLEQEHPSAEIPLNEGKKWNADLATSKNVAAMVKVVNDSSYATPANRRALLANVQNRADILIRECSMKGAAHEALHVWLEKVLKDLKVMQTVSDNDYYAAYSNLKRDMERFYDFFE